MDSFNEMQLIKRRFFAYRNGIIADTLRKAGSPFKIIFGLNVPQLKEIASTIGKRTDLARKLWENKSTRESLLIAPMLFPVEELTEEEALEWCQSTDEREIADGLCHNLLRHTTFKDSLIGRLLAGERDIEHYIALRLAWSLIRSYPERAREIAEGELEKGFKTTAAVATQLIEELNFLALD